jgi:hypothetical protein
MGEIERRLNLDRVRRASDHDAEMARAEAEQRRMDPHYAEFITLMQQHGIPSQPIFSEVETHSDEVRRLTTFGPKTRISVTTKTYAYIDEYWPVGISYHGGSVSGLTTDRRVVNVNRDLIPASRAPRQSEGGKGFGELRVTGDARLAEWASAHRHVDVLHDYSPGGGYSIDELAQAARSLLESGAPLRGYSP